MSHHFETHVGTSSAFEKAVREAAAQEQDCGEQPQPVLGGGNSSGAPPSNTAPANYISACSGITILRYGVDSLYLSYPGALSHQWEQRLDGLKLTARANEDKDRATAQVKIADHLFEVMPQGQGRFAYVLADNWFRISLASSSSKSLPMGYVQFASAMLTALGVVQAEKELRHIINTFGLVREEPNISRVDLFVDFISSHDMHAWPAEAWVTRAQKIGTHHVNRRFSGWSIGPGGTISARLYDKTLELVKSGKDYLKPLWAMGGWQEDQTVWRLEFQFKREALKELGVRKVQELLPNLGGLWRYASSSWLRLTLPSDDNNQTRWPTHPLWTCLSSLPWDKTPSPTLERVRKERIPSDESLFINGIGGITSFMAREGITDLGEGFGEFLARADQFHHLRSRLTGKSFTKYIQEKVIEKGKRYNTLRNEHPDEKAAIEQAAKDYRKIKDGE